jgi:hypothetical protein
MLAYRQQRRVAEDLGARQSEIVSRTIIIGGGIVGT